MKLKNSDKFIKTIISAAHQKKRIVLLGDSDLDGAGAVVILREALSLLSPFYRKKNSVVVYFPDREKEGYGLNKKALSYLSEFAPALLILLDCGIGNSVEIEEAKKKGFEVIIIDHHEILPSIPKCLIIDPKQKGDSKDLRILCTAGLVYELVSELLNKVMIPYNASQFLEVAALSTLADKVPLKGDNKRIVQQGIMALDYTQRPGLRALINLTGFLNQDLKEVEDKLLRALNSSQIVRHINEDYLLFEAQSQNKIQALVKKLIHQGKIKREEADKVLVEIVSRLDKKNQINIIFEGGKNWSLITLGRVASQLVNRYKKPVFLFKIRKKESVASARLPSGVDGVKALEHCSKLLLTYGGHAPACGFRVKNSNLDKLGNCLNKYFKDKT